MVAVLAFRSVMADGLRVSTFITLLNSNVSRPLSISRSNLMSLGFDKSSITAVAALPAVGGTLTNGLPAKSFTPPVAMDMKVLPANSPATVPIIFPVLTPLSTSAL